MDTGIKGDTGMAALYNFGRVSSYDHRVENDVMFEGMSGERR